MAEKNKVFCIDGTDKNLGSTMADKCDINKECHRQLYNESTYFKLSEDARNDLIHPIKFQLKSIVEKHPYRGKCSLKEAKFYCPILMIIKFRIFPTSFQWCFITKWVNRLFPVRHIYLSIYLSSILPFIALKRAHRQGVHAQATSQTLNFEILLWTFQTGTVFFRPKFFGRKVSLAKRSSERLNLNFELFELETSNFYVYTLNFEILIWTFQF